MTVNELYVKLNERIPASLSCEWDNDGLMCSSDGEREVKKALVCLDVTVDAVKKAVSEGLIFKKGEIIRKVDESRLIDELIAEIKNSFLH